MAPSNGSSKFTDLLEFLPEVEPGEGRSAGSQALYQLLALIITLSVSTVSGLATGLILSLNLICNPLEDGHLYDDQQFFNLPDDASSDQEELIEEPKFVRYGTTSSKSGLSTAKVMKDNPRTSTLSSVVTNLEDEETNEPQESTIKDNQEVSKFRWNVDPIGIL